MPCVLFFASDALETCDADTCRFSIIARSCGRSWLSPAVYPVTGDGPATQDVSPLLCNLLHVWLSRLLTLANVVGSLVSAWQEVSTQAICVGDDTG